MYKRSLCLLSALLVMTILLSACGSTPSGSVSESLEPSVSAFAPSGSTSQELPDPGPAYTNPLTGEGTEVDLTANRPVAIMLNNLRKALPQCGVSQADMIYEVCAEGGITRMMAVFQSLDGVGSLGSVRSSRAYYVDLAAGLDAIYIHAGGSDGAYSAIKQYGVFNIDGVNGPYGGTMFWRDANRRKTAGYEHSLFTSEERIEKLLSGSLSKMRQTHKEGYSLPLSFGEDGTPNGSDANTISIRFSQYKTGLFTYAPQSKTYLVSQKVDGKDGPYMDGNNDQQVAVTNVLVLCTDISRIPGDTAGRLDVRLTGSGDGWFACGGKYIPITWSKASANEAFRFTAADGQELELGVGKTYINIVDDSDPVTFG